MSIYTSLPKQFQRDYRAKAGSLLAAARGLAACDLVIRDAQVVNVLSHEIMLGDIWIKNGYVVHVDYRQGRPELVQLSELRAEREYDASGRLVAPGFADAHMHIESTMLTPARLGDVLAVKGTTAIFADPHEIVNVAGEEAFKYMIANSRLSPIRQFFLVPSSVPSVPGLENAGADWESAEIGKMLDLSGDQKNRVVGLAEAMSYIDIISGDQRAVDILGAARSRLGFTQGHIFGAFGRDLSIYQLEGARTNHEALSPEEIAHLICCGMRVDIRLTSSLVSDQVKGLVEAIVACDPDGNMSETCTDDVHISDILAEGHINHTVQKLIEFGDDPIVAVKRASLSVWQSYGVDRAGAIATGYLADLQVLPSEDVSAIGQNPDLVIVNGKVVAEDGYVVAPKHVVPVGVEFEKRNTVNCILGWQHFNIKSGSDSPVVKANAIELKSGEVLTSLTSVEMDNSGDGVLWEPTGLAAVRVFHRHGKSDTVGTGFLKGYPLTGGALASTISHDSHNLTVVYRDAEAAMRAFLALKGCGGGMAYVSPSGELTVLPLPVGGLMSADRPDSVSRQLLAITKAYQADNPGANIMTIVVLALPVIPYYRMSDVGIIDVVNRTIIPLFE
jgi:adenine deaminase